MKKIIAILLSVMLGTMLLVGCGDNKKEANKIYQVGEKVIIKDRDKDMYWIKIDSVKKANNFEYKDDFKNSKEIIEVTYSYGNIDKEDSTLYIHGADLQIADANGTIADSSDMFPKGKPKELTKGTNCTVNAYYGLFNKSNKVNIIFKSDQYNKQIKFEADVK